MPDTKGEYPDGALATFSLVLCFGEHQPQRGRFRNRQVLSALLGRRARWISFLIEHGDLVEQPKNVLYIDGWDEWQEGDWKVAERMKRVRERKKRALAGTPTDTDAVTVPVTPAVTVPTVTGLSEHLAVGGRPLAVGGRHQAGDRNPKPAANGSGQVVRDALADALKERDPDDDLGLQLALVMQGLLGRDLTPLEVSMCSIFVDDFAYLSIDDMKQRCSSFIELMKSEGKQPPRKVHAFRDSLRNQNDYAADHGAPKAWRPPPVASALLSQEADH